MNTKRTAARTPPPILCLGETMVLLTPDSGRLAKSSHLGIHVGGAESNVAAGIAHLGHDVEWISRLGDDPFGRIIIDFLRGRGVHLDRVQVDPDRPTGVYFKDREPGASRVFYYRAGSAASALSPTDSPTLALEHRTLCHVSGITAALSSSANNLLQHILIDHRAPDVLISFDVNYRPALWPLKTAATRLLELASHADIVVVGRDEAQALWGTERAEDVRAILPDVPHLVVKDAGIEAVHFTGQTITHQPALSAEIVEPVGAGDAFAAGYLSGFLRGFDTPRALRLGHLMAGLTLQHVSDLPVLPDSEDIVGASALEGEDWAGIRLNATHLHDLKSLSQKGNTRVH
ncbi:2-dehydro-3-deoxygluconokinase [Pseudarthrobacter sp. W1I19]|uniref:sugar kinase n=1 Tax=Pseudarthrobacter sp. W1I19 TaxID=3042288 RepID=UPI00277FCA0E|nr:sugar kinase [Pseudarthrobacter sp. W1I19]MDQ0921825.1 2-dehydro-3-deoxygluconokinase [Pseudarthrobacter sp. W1I19]